MNNEASYQIIERKPHYAILDGLRGVAAIMVVCYHIFEAFATSPVDQIINHSYLAVDGSVQKSLNTVSNTELTECGHT